MTTLERITPIRELPIENKRVFIRVDFNVPLEEEGGKMNITDDAR
ncbi:MAG TPA: phosphoglycerate kinase, partial [Labilithrix sp.]|nr:phosphoglycerate kinase [Labilithrix sp.]